MNLNNLGCTASGRKLKGFTLIEMLVVIAIIAILAGITSIVMSGFRRDSLIETQNKNAQMVFTAFQDILIDMEINQDKSLFDVYEFNDPTNEIIGGWVFFRISDKDYLGNEMANPGTGLGDEIHVAAMFDHNTPSGYGGGGGGSTYVAESVWSEDSTSPEKSGNTHTYTTYGQDNGAHIWKKWNTAIAGRIDPSMEGTYCVMVDLQNYEVRSVVCRNLVGGRDPKTGLWDPDEITRNGDTGGIRLGDTSLYNYVIKPDNVTPIGGDQIHLPIGAAFVKDKTDMDRSTLEVEKEIFNKEGVYVGNYPFFEDVYEKTGWS